MLLRLRLAAVLVVLLPSMAFAWNPFKAAGKAVGDSVQAGGRRLGQGLGEGAVEALQPALTSTISTASLAASSLVADVDTRLTGQVERAGGVASRLVSQAQGAVGASLDKVDDILEKRILQLQVSANGAIARLDQSIDRNLRLADDILKQRSSQLGQIVSDSIGRADHALEQRIAQLDEAVALRLGNVDVIATKQRIGLEETAVRAGVLLGLLVFVVFVFRTLFRQYVAIQSELAGTHGMRLLLTYLRRFAKPVSLQIAAAGVVVAILYGLYDRLPLGARNQAAQLTDVHRRGMNDSLSRFDFARVRYHAAQLELLVPEQGAFYQGMAGKAALLRDLVMRPALFATDKGVAEIVERVQALERQMGGRADPDVLTMKALVLWQVGDSKEDEHAAASYCARALRMSPRGFALAPLARHYIRMFMHAPYVPPGTPYGRDQESLHDLRILTSAPHERDASFPLSPVLALDRRILKLDRDLVPAYLDMLRAQAELLRLVRASGGRSVEGPARNAARARRTDSAQRVLAIWDEFDRAIAVPELVGKSAVLAVFRLNDASRTRAAWFALNPEADDIAPALADIPSPELRAKLAPPRIGWGKRYGQLIARDIRDLAEFQEASRYAAFETQNRAFERAYVAYLASDDGVEKDEHRRQAAQAAAMLGLYVKDPECEMRVSLAATLTSAADGRDPGVARALSDAMQTRGLRTL